MRSIALESASFTYLAHGTAPEDHVDTLCSAVDAFHGEQRDVIVSSVRIARRSRMCDIVEFILVPDDSVTWNRLEELYERFADLVDKHVFGTA